MTPQDIQDLKLECFINKELIKVSGYINYHKFKVDHAIWTTFDEDIWLHIPHGTYTIALAPIVNSGPRFSKAVSNMASTSPKTPTHTPHLSTHTQTLIDYSAVDPIIIYVT